MALLLTAVFAIDSVGSKSASIWFDGAVLLLLAAGAALRLWVVVGEAPFVVCRPLIKCMIFVVALHALSAFLIVSFMKNTNSPFVSGIWINRVSDFEDLWLKEENIRITGEYVGGNNRFDYTAAGLYADRCKRFS